jgi:hypothetical protein
MGIAVPDDEAIILEVFRSEDGRTRYRYAPKRVMVDGGRRESADLDFEQPIPTAIFDVES